MKSSLFLMVCVAFGFTAVRASADCTTPQCEGFRSDFQKILDTGNEIYCYWDLKKTETKVQYDVMATSTMDQITDQTSMTEFYWMMRRWAGLFHDGHVNFMLSQSGPKIQVAAADIRFDLLAPGSDHEVLIVSEASPSLGLEVGDEIISVGNLSAKEAVDQTLSTTSGSTDRMRRFFGARRIIEVLAPTVAVNHIITFQMRRKSSGSQTTWTVQIPLRTLMAPVPPTLVAQEELGRTSPWVHFEVLPDNIGYLRIDAFSNTVFALEDAMDELSNTDGLVIDVRKNGGGDQSGNAVLARLTKKTLNRYSESPRASPMLVKLYPQIGEKRKIRGTEFTRWYGNPVFPQKSKRFKGKRVFVMTSANCFSACDTFVSALQTYHLAEVIGDGSGGGTGSPLVFSLPYTKHQFRYSTFRGRTHKKKWIEGVGTIPDVLVTANSLDRASGNDVQLLKALELASGKTLSRSKRNTIIDRLGPYHDGQTLEKEPITLETEQAAMQQAFWD